MMIAILLSAAVGQQASATLTPQERQRLIAHLEMTGGWFTSEVADLSPAQLEFRPAPGTWSIMEVIEHVVLVAPIYWEDLQRALKSAPSARASPSSDADILWYGIDRTWREKAIPPEEPKGAVRSLAGALKSYQMSYERLLRFARDTTDDLRRHIVERQQCDAYQWALLISTHEQRHVLQIREIKAHPNYPAR
ncbi:MAG: DinB family protein [Acidobacteriota bacterium]